MESILLNSHYLFELRSATTARHQPPPPSSPQFKISFIFSGNAHFSYWISSPQDSTEIFLESAQTPLMITTVHVNLSQFMSRKKSCEILKQKLRNWPFSGRAQDVLIGFALKKAQERVIRTPAIHNCVYLQIHVASDHEQVFRMSRGSMVDEARMVPADESSIEALESRKILTLANYSENCCVCMDAFLEGCEAVCMPCAHVFHEGCIKDWLRVSHYCPVCRFKMPTTTV